MSEAATLLTGADGATPEVTESASPATTSTAGGTPSPSAPWYGAIEDADLKGWVENKGFKDPVVALQSMKNQEKLIGSPDKIIPMPKDAEDKEGWNKVYDKLGRPKVAADYQIPVPEGDSGEFAKTASRWMHEAGLNTAQARALATKWNEHAAKIVDSQKAEAAIKAETDIANLKKEWGADFDVSVNAADRVNREFGIPKADLDAILAGSEATLIKTLNKIGKGMLEDSYKGDNSSKQFGQTKEGAAAEIKSKRADKDFMTKFHKGDPIAVREMNELYKKTSS